jgi:sugar O-acyltransferase (sialic acid O-acetyltransferase NeuD family)
MIIGGAGGHALELKDELEKKKELKNLRYYVDPEFLDQEIVPSSLLISDLASLESIFKTDPKFALGIGNPNIREKFYNFFKKIGGQFYSVHSITAQISPSSSGSFDAMAFSFVGPETKIGTGVLLNVKASVHHESKIGDFTEISPGAIILGGAEIGRKCRIGAGAVILPGVQLGDEVTVGAGAVVTRNFGRGSKIVGVPAKILPLNI